MGGIVEGGMENEGVGMRKCDGSYSGER